MKKINTKMIVARVGGNTAGTVAAGAVNKALSKTNASGQPMLNDEMRAAVLIAAGIFLPGILSKKNDLFLDSVGEGMTSYGAGILARKYLSNVISGTDDDTVGYNDYADEVGIADIPFDTYVGESVGNTVQGTLS